MVKLPRSESTPRPTVATTAPTIWKRPGERLAMTQYRNGTMATLRPVMKPDLPGVVHCRA